MANFGKLNFSVSFNPTSAFPLDARCYFESLTDAQAAAATAEEVGSSTTKYYYGQSIVVVTSSAATLYTIQPDKTLKEVGSVPVGDGKSITVENGKIKIAGFDGAETGAQPRKKADGTIEWVKPDTTTVEGLQTAISGIESDVSDLQSKISGAYHYKGSVDTYSALPTNAETGDVYNIASEDKANGIKAGDNVAWTGTEWDVLGGTIDLSGYVTTTDLSGKVDKVDGSRLMTTAEATKLDGVEAGAQANVIDSVDTAQFSIDSDKKLTLLDIAMNRVTGLSTALNNKVDKVEGSRLITSEEAKKIATVESNAQENILEAIKLNGTALTVSEKSVNIPVAGENLGVVKSATGDNKVSINIAGEMEVSSVNINTLVQTSGDTLVLNGGTAN